MSKYDDVSGWTNEELIHEMERSISDGFPIHGYDCLFFEYASENVWKEIKRRFLE